MSNDFRSPGQLLEHLLKERNWTQRVLAIVLGMNETVVNKMVSDRRPITAEIALSLEEVFQLPAERFLEIQKSYDLAKARITARADPARNTRAHLFSELPISEMIKRGWLDAKNVRDVPAVESSLASFFGVQKVDEIEFLPHAAKKTAVTEGTTPSQLAWLYRVKTIADDMLVNQFSQHSARRCIAKLRSLMLAPEEARKVPRILAEHGIRFVLVESLKSAKIDGVCLWLDESSPVIGMTTRYDRIDNFWFVLRHELEHILRGDGLTETAIDVELEGERAGNGVELPEEERIANEAAASYSVPRDKLVGFVVRKAPLFAERDLLGFAKTLGVHPGIVAGQLQHYTGRYEIFRNHLVKIRECVAPSAIVDGWGDIAPVGY